MSEKNEIKYLVLSQEGRPLVFIDDQFYYADKYLARNRELSPRNPAKVYPLGEALSLIKLAKTFRKVNNLGSLEYLLCPIETK